MVRSFSAQDIIALPSLSAHATSTLVQQVATQAKAHKLSADLTEALDELLVTKKALDVALGQTSALVTNPAAREADAVIDRAWGATNDWLLAWARLDQTKEAATAQKLLGALFPDGASFTQLKYLAEYSESQHRLDRIAADKLAADFKALGGGVFLRAIEVAHEAYGKALGVTEAKKSAPVASTTVRDALADVQEAMREYVAKVAASVSRKKPKTAELAATLLEPITQLATRKQAPATTTGTAPVVGAPGDGGTAVTGTTTSPSN